MRYMVSIDGIIKQKIRSVIENDPILQFYEIYTKIFNNNEYSLSKLPIVLE